MPYSHIPVLLEEAVDNLKLKPNDTVIDCTLGGGGHAKEILKKIGRGGKYIGIDLDKRAIDASKNCLKGYESQIILVNDSFSNIKEIWGKLKIDKVNGVLLDLGLSSGQLMDESRGFSFSAKEGLDMRFGAQTELTAEKILNFSSLDELMQIFKNYGEERLALPIAREIVALRKKNPINSPSRLSEIVSDVYARFYKKRSKINPATKVFQALRIAVNDELKNLKKVLPGAIEVLAKSARLAVISYHSLEDRIVKDFFREESKNCICPIEIPICRCNHKKNLMIITKKPILPSEKELISNNRARSAKLRIAEKI